ncbi:unnamed protein product [Kuraishia capsulata CBS 1993]|uniref:Nitrogen regulatory protein areA GATA-like domain-containing protein n=1 Tax=Kuraishia capsulata CBS 1993 TaxID=1382522 RepID=W6MIG5_9ASCO|nr:uncharacterized protein KUCA_T00001658001 [Kuraishia capsulata CBS 1993]CDK25688.1 unnamed protein product [Kuraishia capsulata CBS 1993]
MSKAGNLADYFVGGATTSQHVVAKDDDHFHNTTYKLKRTRSVGILDDYIGTSQKLTSEDLVPDCAIDKINNASSHFSTSPTNSIKNDPALASPAPSNNSITSDNSVMTQFSLASQEGPELTEVEDPSIYHQTQQQQSHLTASNKNHIPSAQISSDGRILSLHDDTEMVYEPTRHVDYLSHNWKESDISKSWRYVILRRKDVANSARLENASWRTWAQARNNLKTFPPQELNWSKESDVTWLYGPLYKEHHESDALLEGETRAPKEQALKPLPPKQAVTSITSEARSSSGSASPSMDPHLKPILKKKTNVEKMISEASYARLQTLFDEHDTKGRSKGSPILEAGQPKHGLGSPSSSEYSPITNVTPKEHSRCSSPFSLSNDHHSSKEVVGESAKSVVSEQLSDSRPSIEQKERRIHFNMRVDQCQVKAGYGDHDIVHSDDYYDDDDDEYYDDDDDQVEDEYEDSDEDDGMEIAVLPQIRTDGVLSPALSNTSSHQGVKVFKTIELLPSTTLKTCSDDEDEENEYAVSHNTNTNRGYEFYYDYNRVYPTNSSSDSQAVQICDIPDDCRVESIPEELENYDYMSAPMSGSHNYYPTDATTTPASTSASSASTMKRSTSGNLSGSMGNIASQVQFQASQNLGSSSAKVNSKTFMFDEDNSDSDSGSNDDSYDDNDFLINAPPLSRTTSHTADFKISSSPATPATTVNKTVSGSTPSQISHSGGSYASLSEIASNGYRVPAKSAADMNELNKDFENLHPSQDQDDTNTSPSRLSQFLGTKKSWR